MREKGRARARVVGLLVRERLVEPGNEIRMRAARERVARHSSPPRHARWRGSRAGCGGLGGVTLDFCVAG